MSKKTLIILLAILVIASFFRFWQLDKIPPGLYPDEAMNGNNGLDLLYKGDFRIFYPENNGREGLFVWLLALSFWIFGPSLWSIKAVSALAGTMTVLGTFLLTKEIFKLTEKSKEQITKIALSASFLTAISFWHVNFSRINFRAILIPLILTFGFYLLFRAFDKEALSPKNIATLAASGILFGLGFYTYISYRFIVLLGPLTLFLFGLITKKKSFFKLSLLLVIFIFLTALPLGVYFLKNPGDFFGRATGVSVLSHETPLLKLGESLFSHLGMFNIRGDGNWRHNYAEEPLLLWPVGLIFLLGVFFSVKNTVLSVKQKQRRSLLPYCFLISWFLIMLVPGFLSAEGIPHSLRVIGAIPPVYIMAGMGFAWLSKKLGEFKLNFRSVAFYLPVAIFLIVLTFAQFNKYFFDWGKREEAEHAFSKNYVSLGKYLNSLPEDCEKVVVVNAAGVPVPYPNGIPMPAQTPIFIERSKYVQKRSEYILPKETEKIKISQRSLVITLMKPEEKLFNKLVSQFPHAEQIKKQEIWALIINN